MATDTLLGEMLERNIDRIYPSKEALTKKLKSGKSLKIYLGIDPSSPRIHLGNAIALWKLREFQDKGHRVILLIGDFTGMIGDPTDRNATRKPLTQEQVLANAETYAKQASKILQDRSQNPKNPFEIKYNSHWLSKLTFAEVIKLAGHFTIQQLLERDMFQKRLAENKPIGLHEFLYPLMQGYDSVAMDVDIEIGGTDQTFNMLVGRELVGELSGKEKFVITVPLLEGSDGRKMSKSFENSVDITSSPTEMYGKIMALDDSLILKYFEFCTSVSLTDLKRVRVDLQKSNPMKMKKQLAHQVVTLYHSAAAADQAEAEFQRVFQEKGLPDVIEEIEFQRSILPKSYSFFLLETGLVSSTSEAARLASQGGVVFDDDKIENVKGNLQTEKDKILIRVGKRRFKIIKFK